MSCQSILSSATSLMDPLKDSSTKLTITSVDAEPVNVKIPDLFLSFCAQPPRVNPNYARVKAESESWITEESGYDAKKAKKHKKANFSFLASVLVPDADAERLRCLGDWLNWAFDFDDPFDEGEFNNDPSTAEQLVKAILATMDDQIDEKLDLGKYQSLVDVFRDIWIQLAKDSSAGVRYRFKTSMADLVWGVFSQVKGHTSVEDLDPVSYMDLRRSTIGTSAAFALVEYCYSLNVLPEVMNHSSIKRIERLSAELTILQNDVLSYYKEQKEGCEYNLIAIYRRQGLSLEASYDVVENLIRTRYREWFLALADVPLLGEGVDADVQRYIEGCTNMVIGGLNWSFKCERYFGADTETVRKTRLVPRID